jgi:hypothetical protein
MLLCCTVARGTHTKLSYPAMSWTKEEYGKFLLCASWNTSCGNYFRTLTIIFDWQFIYSDFSENVLNQFKNHHIGKADSFIQ